MPTENNGKRFFLALPKYSSRSPQVVLVLALLAMVVGVVYLIFVRNNSRWPVGLLFLTNGAAQLWTIIPGWAGRGSGRLSAAKGLRRGPPVSDRGAGTVDEPGDAV